MATVRPFRGVRYLPERVELSLVLAPAGAIDEATREALYEREPRNAVRVVASRPEPGEPEDAPAHRAALHLAEWRRARVLGVDEQPSLYLLRQTFRREGEDERSVTGLFAALRLDAEARRDVQGLGDDDDPAAAAQVQAQRRHLSIAGVHADPVVLRYRDDGGRIERALSAEMEEREPDLRARAFGAQFELWIIDDETTTARVARQLEEQPLTLLEGEPRYRAALALEEARASRASPGAVDNEPLSVMALFVDAAAEGAGSPAGDHIRPPRGFVFSPLVALGDDDG